MQQLLWSFKDHDFGDITLVKAGNEYHLFAEGWLKTPPNTVAVAPDHPVWAKTHGVLHAVSRDLYAWQELPMAITCGTRGSFDGYLIYHLDVWLEDGKWWMFYTGLDRPEAGQKQAIGLATSHDGITWTKHHANPVLEADPRWYEPLLPPESPCTLPDHIGRQVFRDPCIIRDQTTGQYGMVVAARSQHQPVDTRGCLAWATSLDLLHWQADKPLFSPGLYHTVETPSIFKRGNRHYLVYMTDRFWGVPIDTGAPYQDGGMCYAVSHHGIQGPYTCLEPGFLSGKAVGWLRLGAARCLALSDAPEPPMIYYGWLHLHSEAGDSKPSFPARRVVPPPKDVRFEDDGRMKIIYRPQIEQYTRQADPSLMQWSTDQATGWVDSPDGGWACKSFHGKQNTLLTQGQWGDGIVSVTIDFQMGDRAGLVIRTAADNASQVANAPGLEVAVDRNKERVELITADTRALIDARRWPRCHRVHLRVVAIGPSIDIYLDDQHVIHQGRHREVSGRLGLLVDNAQASFSQWSVRQSLDSK